MAGNGRTGALRERLRRWWSGTPPPKVDELLRRVIASCDGADRAMVEVMAEEEGISWQESRRAIDRLLAEGRLLGFRDAEGIVRLRWADATEGR